VQLPNSQQRVMCSPERQLFRTQDLVGIYRRRQGHRLLHSLGGKFPLFLRFQLCRVLVLDYQVFLLVDYQIFLIFPLLAMRLLFQPFLRSLHQLSVLPLSVMGFQVSQRQVLLLLATEYQAFQLRVHHLLAVGCQTFQPQVYHLSAMVYQAFQRRVYLLSVVAYPLPRMRVHCLLAVAYRVFPLVDCQPPVL
jgi:hypothetical protein